MDQDAIDRIDTSSPSNPSDGDIDLSSIVMLDDETHLKNEFTMDADAVMGVLGIKRSRLTQISGKELRVGKLKVDRYTRPFYRPEDVEAYKNWTRATASHQTSAKVLEEAGQLLKKECIEIKTNIEEGHTKLLKDFEKKTQKSLFSSAVTHQNRSNYLSQQLRSLFEFQSRNYGRQSKHVDSQHAKLQTLEAKIDLLACSSKTHMEIFVQSQSLLKEMLLFVKERESRHKESESLLLKQLEDLQTYQTTTVDVLSVQIQQLHQALAGMDQTLRSHVEQDGSKDIIKVITTKKKLPLRIRKKLRVRAKI